MHSFIILCCVATAFGAVINTVSKVEEDEPIYLDSGISHKAKRAADTIYPDSIYPDSIAERVKREVKADPIYPDSIYPDSIADRVKRSAKAAPIYPDSIYPDSIYPDSIHQ